MRLLVALALRFAVPFGVLVLALPVQAQVRYAARAGATIARIEGDFRLAEAYEARTGFAAGLAGRMPLRGPVAFQAEVLYTQAGGRIDGATAVALGDSLGLDRTVELTYFEVPLLLVLDEVGLGGVSFRPHAGVSVGIEFGEVVQFEGAVQREEIDQFTSPILSLAVGADVEVPLAGQRAFVGARYTHGLTDLAGGEATTADGRPASAHSRVWLFSAGMFF